MLLRSIAWRKHENDLEVSKMEMGFDDQRESFDIRSSVMTDMFQDDLELLRRQMDIDKKQTWRRCYCIRLIAYVEWRVNRLHESVLEFYRTDDWPPEGVDPTLRKLREAGDKCSGVISDDRSLPLMEDLVYAMQEYGYANEACFEVKRNAEGWRAMELSVVVHDRVTSPTRASDLVISDDEIRTIEKAFAWFETTMRELDSACLETLEQILENMSRFGEQASPEPPDLV
jgi:hypothetical protein